MSEEYLFLCDENDTPLQIKVLRSEVHRTLSYWHRTTGITIRNEQGEILCHQRSFEKDENPGVWSYVFGGHVAYGEEVLHCAIKEMEEEVGLILAPEELHFHFVLKNPKLKHLSYRYVVDYRPALGDITMKDGEVIALEWIGLDRLVDPEFMNGRFTSVMGQDMYEVLKM